ncbi:MAG TPA: hypothetical protein VM076_07360 [Gemmatimonadaceae bacterium]|nr:hypothetical protein [Gemmatimonadaceae bacterium]
MRCPRVLALGTVLACVVSARSLAQSASASQEPFRLTPAQMREDLAAFRDGFMARDNSFSAAARAQAESRLRALDSSVERLTPVAFELELARIVALADNGHTNASAAARLQHYNRVPVRLAVFGEAFYVLRATSANADLLGAKLVTIDGHDVRQLRDSARVLVGGIPSRRDRSAPYVLESPEQLHALGLAAAAERATYSFQRADGRSVGRRLDGIAPQPGSPPPFGEQWLFPQQMPRDEGTWRGVLDSARAPWSLGEPRTTYRWRAAPELAAMVIELRATTNSPTASITSFLDEVASKLEAQRPRNVVLDMRFNGGGNLNTARDFMKRLPTLVPGRIFVLTSPVTFSAAISSIGYLKQAAPDRVTIVGEGVGDRLVFFAEGTRTMLPNSGASISFSTQRHDYNNGCKAFTDCHPPVVANPIAVASLAPDVAAPWTVESYRAGRDPGIDAIAAELRRRP